MKVSVLFKTGALVFFGLLLGLAAANSPGKDKADFYLSGTLAFIGMAIALAGFVYFVYSWFQDNKKPRYGYN